MSSVLVIYTVLLTTAFLPSSSGLCSYPGGSSGKISIHSHRNASGHWIITVDTVNTRRGDAAIKLSAIGIEQETVTCGDEESLHLQTTALLGATVLHSTGRVTNTSEWAESSSQSSGEQTTATQRPTATSRAGVPEGYESLPGVSHHYKVYSERTSWDNARTKCQQEGADLMLISSDEELAVARALFNKHKSRIGSAFFIGLHNRNIDGNFYTIRGDLVSGSKYSLWHEGHSLSKGGSKCGVIDSDGVCERDCGSDYAFACQIDG